MPPRKNPAVPQRFYPRPPPMVQPNSTYPRSIRAAAHREQKLEYGHPVPSDLSAQGYRQSPFDPKTYKHMRPIASDVPQRVVMAAFKNRTPPYKEPRPSNANEDYGFTENMQRSGMLAEFAKYCRDNPPDYDPSFCQDGQLYQNCTRHRHLSLLPPDPTHDYRGNIMYRIGTTLFS